MKKGRMISWLCSLIFLLFQLTLPVFSSSALCPHCHKLSEKGFPASYREGLCALLCRYPDWEFDPLLVTELSKEKGEAYTFSHVLEEEWRVEGRSLVFASEEFKPYFEDTNRLYDSGFFRANREAVAYFLDPRNFFSEEGIFQFLLLSGEGEYGKEEVMSLLEGSALEKLSGSFPGGIAAFLVEIGKEWNLNPLYLAARLRQEQGSEGNALLWGNAGSFLGGEDVALDGYFNPFNISATGSGEREIYRSGALHAKKMGWDTPEKAIRGGVEKLAKEYVELYQNTLYLQKWNVDPRSATAEGSRNFWAQFMQNIGGAKTEGELLSRAFSNLDGEALCFSIPVFEGMPEVPSPDPAKGACTAFATDPLTASPHMIPLAVQAFSPEASAVKPSSVVGEAATAGKGAWKHMVLFLFQIAALSAAIFPFFGRKKGEMR